MVRKQHAWVFCLKKKDMLLICAAGAFALLKLYLVNCQSMTALGHAQYDDRLFIDLARDIGSGDWLGSYNVRTLIKGVVYPVWVAVNSKLGVPLLFAAHCLYIGACFSLIFCYKKKFNNISLFILYLIILYNPMSFTDGVMTQAIRSNIYPALALMIVGSLSYLIFNRSRAVIQNVYMAILFGFLFPLFWFTREESLWMAPLLVMVFIYMFKNQPDGLLGYKRYLHGMLPTFIAMFVFTCVVFALTSTNNYFYGAPVTLEIKSHAFKKAYGALLRIKHDGSEDTTAIPVPKKLRQKIYQTSPAFRELEPFFKGSRGRSWADILYHCRHQLEKYYSPAELQQILADSLQVDNTGVWIKVWDDAREKKGEIFAPWFIWAFREAVFEAGYSTLPKAQDYYDRLSSEIYYACKEGKLECFPLRASLMPPWNDRYVFPLAKALATGIIRMATFKGFNPVPELSVGDQESMNLFRQITHEELWPVDSKISSLRSKDYRFKILAGLGVVYGKIVPGLALISILRYFFMVLKLKLSVVCDEIWGINTGLLFSILLLLLALSYIHITSFPALLVRYMAPLYPLMLLFIFLSLNVHVAAPRWGIFSGKRKGK